MAMLLVKCRWRWEKKKQSQNVAAETRGTTKNLAVHALARSAEGKNTLPIQEAT